MAYNVTDVYTQGTGYYRLKALKHSAGLRFERNDCGASFTPILVRSALFSSAARINDKDARTGLYFHKL